MTDNQNPNAQQSFPPPPHPTPSSSKLRVSGEIGSNGYSAGGQKAHPYPNPPDLTNPDPATLREQWRFAIKQYSRWYSHAWGTAILAGLSFFALGWIIKGSNPLPSFDKHKGESNNPKQPGSEVPTPPISPTVTASPSDAYQTPKS